MGTSLFAQIRKLNIIIYGSTQFFSHLNGRIAEQVDYLLKFQDLHFSNWGRKYHIGKGIVAEQKWYDLSGQQGKSARNEFHPHLISGEPYRKTSFYMYAYREYFDSHKLTALNQRFQSFYLEKQKIKVPGDNGNGGNSKSTGQENPELKNYLISTFKKLRDSGTEYIKAGALFGIVRNDGFDIDLSQLGISLYKLGIEKEYKRLEGERGIFYKVKEI
jgi:hypothetical protein